MAEITIRLNGVDITSDVIFQDARFTSMANGNVGTCEFRIRDLLHIYHTIKAGQRITVDVDGDRVWAGYVAQKNPGYFFEARDCSCPQTVPLYYRVVGADINILLNRRFLFDLVNPSNPVLEAFPAETPDDEVIKYYVEHYLDLTDDDIDFETLVEHVGTPSVDQEISEGAGITWNQFMAFVAYNTGSVWYIDPDRKLVYTDVDTPNAPFEISDNPGPGQVGCQNMTALFDGTRLMNDALVWGAGGGSNQLVLGRVTDSASIAEHNLWQVGRVAAGVWKQATADRTASTYVNGSPQSQRGGKIDRHSVECTVYEPGLRVAQKVHFYSDVFDYDEVIPIRILVMTFPTPDSVRYQITLAHEIDEPMHPVDPLPRIDNRKICTNIWCGINSDVPDLTASTTASGTATGVAYAGARWGDNDWTVYIGPDVWGTGINGQVNYWQWENDPDFRGSYNAPGEIGHRVMIQWSDLYTYTSLPGQLIAKGGLGWELANEYNIFTTPLETAIPGRFVPLWYGLATLTVTVSGETWDRPREAFRPLFPFTSWRSSPLEDAQVATWGFWPIELEEGIDDPDGGPVPLGNERWHGGPMAPDRVDTSQGTPYLDSFTPTVYGERMVRELTPGTYTITIPTGQLPANTAYREWCRLRSVSFDLAAGDVTLAISSTFEWFPVVNHALGEDGFAGDPGCEPRCITIGDNCQVAERLGSRSYRVLGRYDAGTTRVTVNGIRQELGATYTESDPANGVITFTEAIDPEAFVFICYSAFSLAEQLPSYDITENVFQVPVQSAPITGYFGPQVQSVWPSEVWHGTYYQYFHNGVDFGVGEGTPVFAAAGGTVDWEDQAAGGTMIHIYHDDPDTPIPMRTTYAHLSARVVSRGARVEQGDHIAYSGASGSVTGAHLHWGVVIYGWAEDPLPWTNTGFGDQQLPLQIPGPFT